MAHHDHDDHDHDTAELPPVGYQERRRTAYGPEATTRREEREVVYRSSWSPSQIVALVGGVLFAVLGGIALARGGFGDVTAHIEVGGFHHTSLLGLIEIGLGLLLLAMAAIPGVERSGLVFVGALALAFGIVVVVQGEAFHGVLGTHANNGWLYVLFGGILLIAALLAPMIFQDRTVYGRSSR